MKTRSFLAAGLLVLASTLPSFGSVLIFHDNFESYTQGSSPVNPGDGNASNWFFTGLTSSAVIAGGSANGETPNENLLLVTGTSTSFFGRSFLRQDGVGRDNYNVALSFKLNLNALAGNDYSIRLIDSSLTANNAPVSIRIASNGSVLALTRSTGPGTGSAINSTNPLGGTLKADNWYEFLININLSAQTYELVINDLDSGRTGSTGPLFFAQNIKSIDQLLFLSTSGVNPGVNWSIDDFRMSAAIPEPSSTAALMMGVGLLSLVKLVNPLRIFRKR